MINLLRDNGVPISNLTIDEIKQMPVWDTLPHFGMNNLFLNAVTSIWVFVLTIFFFTYIVIRVNPVSKVSSHAKECVITDCVDCISRPPVAALLGSIIVGAIAAIALIVAGGQYMAHSKAVKSVNTQIMRDSLSEHYDLPENTTKDILSPITIQKIKNLSTNKDEFGPVVVNKIEEVVIATGDGFAILPKVLLVKEGENIILQVMENDLSPSISFSEAVHKLKQE